MEKIEGLKLDELIKQASDEILTVQGHKAVNCIKNLIHKINGLAGEIKCLEGQLTKKREKLAKAEAKFKLVKEGNWSILTEDIDKGEQNG